MLANDLKRATVEMVQGDIFSLYRSTIRGPGLKTTIAELQEFARLLAADDLLSVGAPSFG
jgi:hypothetical protein